jgi:hypothetical protein
MRPSIRYSLIQSQGDISENRMDIVSLEEIRGKDTLDRQYRSY